MSVLTIQSVKNPILREKAKSVQKYDKRIGKLLKDLETTLKAQKDPEGVGLAAPQVGISTKVFVTLSGKRVIPFINPEITWRSEETNDPSTPLQQVQGRSGQVPSKNTQRPNNPTAQEPKTQDYIMEGCLSLPHYYGPVKRAKTIKVRYQIPKLEIGNKQSLALRAWKLEITTKSFTGLLAQIVQHEIDHLNGVLFVDRLLEQKRKLYHWGNNEWQEVELP